jgi:hypothetical protein
VLAECKVGDLVDGIVVLVRTSLGEEKFCRPNAKRGVFSESGDVALLPTLELPEKS